MAKTSKKSIVSTIVIVVLVIAVATTEYFIYNYAFKRGYAEGSNNQVICQASVSNPTLTKLCK